MESGWKKHFIFCKKERESFSTGSSRKLELNRRQNGGERRVGGEGVEVYLVGYLGLGASSERILPGRKSTCGNREKRNPTTKHQKVDLRIIKSRNYRHPTSISRVGKELKKLGNSEQRRNRRWKKQKRRRKRSQPLWGKKEITLQKLSNIGDIRRFQKRRSRARLLSTKKKKGRERGRGMGCFLTF